LSRKSSPFVSLNVGPFARLWASSIWSIRYRDARTIEIVDMSHNNVGSVYHTIIEDVIKSSDIDFAESGVEVEVLTELRLVSTLRVSHLRSCRHVPVPAVICLSF
jgi:hypothetical protein